MGRRTATELNQAGLVWMECQRECFKPFTHRIKETASLVLMLEANHEIIGIAHDNHVAVGLLPSPAFGPEIERVVQVSIGEQRRNH